MTHEQTHFNQTFEKGTSLNLRLMIPTFVVLSATFFAMLFAGLYLAERLYNEQTVDTLNSHLQLTQKALEEGWRNTEGATIRTPEVLKEYITAVLAGRIDFMTFSPHTGVSIVDADSLKTIHTYPSERLNLTQAELENILKNTSQKTSINTLEKGTALSTYFAPLGVYIISFNKQNYAETQLKKTQEILLFTIFSMTAVLVFTFIFLVVYISVNRPLLNMQKGMDRIIQNNSFEDTKLSSRTGASEIRQLAARFNTLIEYVAERDHEIHRHADKLEELVIKRTAELQKAQEKLVLSERLAAIGEFASSVAHELRNPLASIKMGVEKIAETQTLEGNNTRRMTLIKQEIERLSEMLTGILAFAAPSPLNIEKIELNSFIENMLETFEAFLVNGGLKLSWEKEGVPVFVNADGNKLKQTLLNIIKNACEAAPSGSEVILKITPFQNEVHINITNHGTPLSEGVMSRLFEPFFTTKKEGTGLGLPTTKRFMQEMGGDITLKNIPENQIQTTILLEKAL